MQYTSGTDNSISDNAMGVGVGVGGAFAKLADGMCENVSKTRDDHYDNA